MYRIENTGIEGGKAKLQKGTPGARGIAPPDGRPRTGRREPDDNGMAGAGPTRAEAEVEVGNKAGGGMECCPAPAETERGMLGRGNPPLGLPMPMPVPIWVRRYCGSGIVAPGLE